MPAPQPLLIWMTESLLVFFSAATSAFRQARRHEFKSEGAEFNLILVCLDSDSLRRHHGWRRRENFAFCSLQIVGNGLSRHISGQLTGIFIKHFWMQRYECSIIFKNIYLAKKWGASAPQPPCGAVPERKRYDEQF